MVRTGYVTVIEKYVPLSPVILNETKSVTVINMKGGHIFVFAGQLDIGFGGWV